MKSLESILANIPEGERRDYVEENYKKLSQAQGALKGGATNPGELDSLNRTLATLRKNTLLNQGLAVSDYALDDIPASEFNSAESLDSILKASNSLRNDIDSTDRIKALDGLIGELEAGGRDTNEDTPAAIAELKLAKKELERIITNNDIVYGFYASYEDMVNKENAELAEKKRKLQVRSGRGTQVLDALTGTNTAETNRQEAAAIGAKQLELEEEKGLVAGALLGKELGVQFKEQCFIQNYVFELAALKQQYFDQLHRLPYEEGADSGFNRPLVVQGEPFAFMNKMTQPKSNAALFELPSTVLSQLQPYIRLFKVSTNDNGEDGAAIEIKFPSKIEFGKDKNGKMLSITEALRNSKRRGHGVGVKNFSFAYEGSDPFSVKKSISARLSIFAASFEELLEDRGGYAYSDLALKTGGSVMGQNVQSDINSQGVIDNIEKLKFRLRVIIGYSMPKNLHIPNLPGVTRDNIQKAIYNSFITLELTPTIHDFKFDDSGRINFSIDYLAYVEDFFDQAYFNIFSDVNVTGENFRRKVLRKYYEKNCMLGKLNELKEREEEKVDEEQRASFRTLIEKMLIKGNVYNIKVSYDELGNFAIDPNKRLEDVLNLTAAQSPSAAAATIEKEAKEAGTSTPPTKSETPPGLDGDACDANVEEEINFFYLSDLVSVAMENIETSLGPSGYPAVLDKMAQIPEEFRQEQKMILSKMRDNYRQLRILLGPIELRNPRDAKTFSNASIGDIPISLKYFAEWMTTKVIARDRLEYNLSRFVNDFVKNYLRNFLNNEVCYGGRAKQRVSFYSSTVTSYNEGTDGKDEISSFISELISSTGTAAKEQPRRLDLNGISVSGLLNTMGRRDLPNAFIANKKNQYNYQMFYAGRSAPNQFRQGNKEADEAAGVFHYILGRDRGIIKNIDLTRTQVNGLKELRFEQEGFDGLQQLREVYDASVKTFALPSAYPGTYIFIEPRGFAPDTDGYKPNKIQLNAYGKKIDTNFSKYDLSKYGIGGYFMIVKSEHSFAEGLAESRISAKWVAEIDGTSTNASDSTTEITSPAGDNTKCKAKRKRSTISKDVQIQIGPPTDSVGTPTAE